MNDSQTDYFSLLGAVSDAHESGRIEEALDKIDSTVPLLRSKAEHWRILSELLFIGGVCHFDRENFDAAEEHFREALALHKQNCDSDLSRFLYELSLVDFQRGNIDNSRLLLQQAIDSYLESAVVVARSGFVQYYHYDLNPVCPMLSHLALLLQRSEQFDQAIDGLTLARVIAERSCNLRILGTVLNELGLAQIGAGEYGKGMKALVESVRVKMQSNPRAVPITLANIQRCIQLSADFRSDPELPAHLDALKRLLQ